jgi:hypothetical protein
MLVSTPIPPSMTAQPLNNGASAAPLDLKSLGNSLPAAVSIHSDPSISTPTPASPSVNASRYSRRSTLSKTKRKGLWLEDEVALERAYSTPHRAKVSQLNMDPPPPPLRRDFSLPVSSKSRGTGQSKFRTPSECYYKRQRTFPSEAKAFNIQESLLVPDLPPLSTGSASADCSPIRLRPRMVAADHRPTSDRERQMQIHQVSLERDFSHVASISSGSSAEPSSTNSPASSREEPWTVEIQSPHDLPCVPTLSAWAPSTENTMNTRVPSRLRPRVLSLEEIDLAAL